MFQFSTFRYIKFPIMFFSQPSWYTTSPHTSRAFPMFRIPLSLTTSPHPYFFSFLCRISPTSHFSHSLSLLFFITPHTFFFSFLCRISPTSHFSHSLSLLFSIAPCNTIAPFPRTTTVGPRATFVTPLLRNHHCRPLIWWIWFVMLVCILNLRWFCFVSLYLGWNCLMSLWIQIKFWFCVVIGS